jgi:hypothetical protein
LRLPQRLRAHRGVNAKDGTSVDGRQIGQLFAIAFSNVTYLTLSAGDRLRCDSASDISMLRPDPPGLTF